MIRGCGCILWFNDVYVDADADISGWFVDVDVYCMVRGCGCRWGWVADVYVGGDVDVYVWLWYVTVDEWFVNASVEGWMWMWMWMCT